MLRVVVAYDFLKRMGSGKTRPCLVGCRPDLIESPSDETADRNDENLELVVKFSAGLDLKLDGLITETLTAVFAADLGLPVPEPFLVRIRGDFATAIPDPEIRRLAEKSLGWAFGASKLPPQYSTIVSGVPLLAPLIPVAGEILAFDVIISNPDRRRENPNCLSNSQQLAIFDHEMAFTGELSIGWRPPWKPGGIDKAAVNRHLFFPAVKGRKVSLARLQGALEAITPGRIEEYRHSLPEEWGRDSGCVERILRYIRALRDNASTVIRQFTPLLK